MEVWIRTAWKNENETKKDIRLKKRESTKL